MEPSELLGKVTCVTSWACLRCKQRKQTEKLDHAYPRRLVKQLKVEDEWRLVLSRLKSGAKGAG